MKYTLFAVFCSLLVSACAAMTTPSSPQRDTLALHNQLRSKHGAPAMQWDDKLASFAAKHAARCQFKHSSGSYGENIAAGFPTSRAAIQAWYDEVTDYSFTSPGYSSSTGHFTQLVWKSSTRLGCAVASCNGTNGTPGKFLVCEYSPAGNILGRKYFAANVAAVHR